MKSILITLLLIFEVLLAAAQGSKAGATATASTAAAAPAGTIQFNYRTKLTTPANAVFPFDRRFYLEIDSVPTNNISSIAVYSIKYRNGLGYITDNVKQFREPNTRRSSFEFGGQDTATSKNSITLHFPALKPEQDFDILITKQFSAANLKRAYSLNKVLDNPDWRNVNDLATLNGIPVSGGKFTSLKLQFNELLDSANNNQYVIPKKIFTLKIVSSGADNGNPYENVKQYKTYFFDPVKLNYTHLLEQTASAGGFSFEDFFDQAAIKKLSSGITKDFALHNHLYVLQKILNDPDQVNPPGGLFKNILLGKLSIDYGFAKVLTDPYDFNGRIKNLNTSYKYLDSLNNAILLLQSSDPTYSAVAKKTQSLLNVISKNKAYLSTNGQAITQNILTNSAEALWVIGQNTNSQDLQTLGNRKFTIDAGLANIWVNNRKGEFTPLLKLFIGFDYYFRSIDKTVDFNYIPDPGEAVEGGLSNHYLESRKTFGERFALSIGATLGSMGNKDFDNFYGNFSFTFGGSYVVTKGIKVSSGIALLKRFDANPLMSSQHSTIVGPFVALSADYDLIGIISNFTSQLFK